MTNQPTNDGGPEILSRLADKYPEIAAAKILTDASKGHFTQESADLLARIMIERAKTTTPT